MPVLHQLQPSFNNGEISPLLYDRVDFQKFVSSVKSGKNMFVHPQGGMSNRAGTVMLAQAKDEVVRLIPFEFSSTETYIIEFGNGYCRFFTSNGQVVVEEEIDGETAEVPYEIQSPFTTADLDKIRYCQSGDVMYIAWGKDPYVLIRKGHTDWTFAKYDYKNGPFGLENSDDSKHIAIKYITENGNYKITSDYDLFNESSVGQLFSVKRSFNAGYISGTVTSSSGSFHSANALCQDTYTLRTSGTWTGTCTTEYSTDLVGWKTLRKFSSANDFNIDYAGSLPSGTYWVRVSAEISSGSLTFNFSSSNFEEKFVFKVLSYVSATEVSATYTGNIAGISSFFVDGGGGEISSIIPRMTSNTTPYGIASGDSIIYSQVYTIEPYVAFAGVPYISGTSSNPFPNTYLIYKGETKTISYTTDSNNAFYFQKITFYGVYFNSAGGWTHPVSLNALFPGFTISYSFGGSQYSAASYSSTVLSIEVIPNGNKYQTMAKIQVVFPQPFLADSIRFTMTAYNGTIPGYSQWSGYRCGIGNIEAFGIDTSSGDTAVSFSDFSVGLWIPNTTENPTEVDLYQDRIVWGTYNRLDATKISDYENFGVSTDVTEDDSISVIIKDKKVDKINSIVAGQKLAVYSDDGNFVHNNDTFTPNAATFLKQGATGGSEVKPVVVRDHIIYAHPMKQAISDYAYSFETDGYAGQDITLLANHLFDGKVIKTLAYQQEPHSIIWVLQEEGTVLACTYLRQQNVIAWTPMDFGGKVLSIAVCSTGTEENLYLAVQRTNGTFVEKMPTRLLSSEPEECFFVDCGRTYRGEPATIISGLDYLEGQNVVALADGNVVKDLVVTNGQITLPIPASVVTVGLPYESVLETLTFDANTGDGSNLNRKKRVVAVSIRYNASRGSKLSVNGHKEVDMLRREQEGYNIPIALKSGMYREIIASTHDERTTIKIKQDEPLPITIVSIIPEIEYER